MNSVFQGCPFTTFNSLQITLQEWQVLPVGKWKRNDVHFILRVKWKRRKMNR